MWCKNEKDSLVCCNVFCTVGLFSARLGACTDRLDHRRHWDRACWQIQSICRCTERWSGILCYGCGEICRTYTRKPYFRRRTYTKRSLKTDGVFQWRLGQFWTKRQYDIFCDKSEQRGQSPHNRIHYRGRLLGEVSSDKANYRLKWWKDIADYGAFLWKISIISLWNGKKMTNLSFL